VELCGGTHVERTGDIGLLRIVAESGVAAGIRRIEAATGPGALARIHETEARLQSVCGELRAAPDNVVERAAALRREHRDLEKEIERLQQKLASSAGTDLTAGAVQVKGIQVLAANVEGADDKSLRGTLDQLRNKLGSAVILLAAVNEGKIALVAGVTKDLTDRVQAGDVMREFAGRLGGKGGGRPDMAQGGGSDVASLDSVLGDLPHWVEARL